MCLSEETQRASAKFNLIKCTAIASLVSSGIQIIGAPLFRIAFPKKTQNYALVKISDLLDQFDSQINKIAPYIEPIVNITCLVCYVAMIAFNHISAGIIGLSGLLLIAVKRFQYLPASCESFLNMGGNLAHVYQSAVSTTRTPLRQISLFLSIFNLINKLSKYESFYSFLPSWGMKSLSTQKESDPLKDFIKSSRYPEEGFKALTFTINPDSIHKGKETSVLPPDFEKTLESQDLKNLYDQVEARQEREKIVFTDNESKGWEKLKNTIQKYKMDCAFPPNLKTLIHYLKGVLFLCAQEEMPSDAFQSKIKELAKIGGQCPEGWTRDLGFLLNPSSKEDYKWAIHHYHAIFRGEIIKTSILKSFNMLTENHSQEERQKLLDSVGGSNNVHVQNHIQRMLEHRWNTYDSQVYTSIYGKSLTRRFEQWLLPKSVQDPFTKGLVEWLFFHSNRTFSLPSKFYSMVHENAKENYTIDGLVDMIYEKAKPVKLSIEGYDLTDETSREISWSAITSWFSSVDNKGFEIIDDKGVYNTFWVQKLDYGKTRFSLTKEGIKLLLWDLGILKETSPESDKLPPSPSNDEPDK